MLGQRDEAFVGLGQGIGLLARGRADLHRRAYPARLEEVGELRRTRQHGAYLLGCGFVIPRAFTTQGRCQGMQSLLLACAFGLQCLLK